MPSTSFTGRRCPSLWPNMLQSPMCHLLHFADVSTMSLRQPLRLQHYHCISELFVWAPGCEWLCFSIIPLVIRSRFQLLSTLGVPWPVQLPFLGGWKEAKKLLDRYMPISNLWHIYEATLDSLETRAARGKTGFIDLDLPLWFVETSFFSIMFPSIFRTLPEGYRKLVIQPRGSSY